MQYNLKEELFRCGIFGTEFSSFSIDRQILYLGQKWLEIVTKEQISALKQSFTQVSLEDCRSKLNIEDPNILEFVKDKYIRMNTIEWKNYFCSNFNFISKEYYFIFDLLIITDDYVPVSDIRVMFGIDPKKMFYIVKKLVSLGYIEKTVIGNNKLYIKYKKNEDNTFYRGMIKQKNESINCEDHNIVEDTGGFEQKMKLLSNLEFLIDVPLRVVIRDIINKATNGLSSLDIQSKIGISIKRAHKLLTKYSSKYPGTIKAVDEFEGKIRRIKFYNIIEYKKRRNERKRNMTEDNRSISPTITYEDRINAINFMLSTRKAIVLDKRNIQYLQQISGSKYYFDRKTLIRTAKKGGLNVYYGILSDGHCKYIIAHPEISEEDEIIKKMFEARVKISDFERKIHNFFVIPPRQVEMDNGFEGNKFNRVILFYKFIMHHMTVNRLEKVQFSMELIYEMPLLLYLKLFSFRRLNFIKDLVELIDTEYNEKNTSDTHPKSSEHIVEDMNSIIGLENIPDKNGCYTGEIYITENKGEKNCSIDVQDICSSYINRYQKILSECTIGNFIKQKLSLKRGDEFIQRFKISRHILYLREFVKYGIFKNESINGIEHLSCCEVDWSKVYNDMKKKIVNEQHVLYETRDNLFQGIRDFEPSSFYNNCYKYIYENCDERSQKYFLSRLFIFQKMYLDSVDKKREELNRGDVTQISKQLKRTLLSGIKLDINGLIFDGVDMLEEVLEGFSRNRIIAGYKTIKSLKGVYFHDLFIKRMNVNIENLLFKECDADLRRDDYYYNFLNMIYHVLIVSGCLEKEVLLENIKIFTENELLEFLEVYSDIFCIEYIDNTYTVSIRE